VPDPASAARVNVPNKLVRDQPAKSQSTRFMKPPRRTIDDSREVTWKTIQAEAIP
jgi:hypothetical protein